MVKISFDPNSQSDVEFVRSVIDKNNMAVSPKPKEMVKGELVHIDGIIEAVSREKKTFKLKEAKDWYFMKDEHIIDDYKKDVKIQGEFYKTAFRNVK